MIKAWIEAMRLRTLPLSVSGVVVACGCAVRYGVFKPLPAVICLVFALLCQIASNFANEYFDYRTGRDAPGREGPRRGVTEGDITPAAMKHAVFGTLAVAALLGLSLIYWGGPWLIAAGVVIVLGALAYSAGPFPLSTHCLGEVAVVIFFGIVPINLTYYVMAGGWNKEVAVYSVFIGLMIANVLIVNNTRDIPDDRKTGKHTLATVFGAKGMQVLYLFNGLAGVLCTSLVWMGATRFYNLIPIICVVVVWRLSQNVRNVTGRALTATLSATSVFTLIYCIALAIRLATTEPL